MEHKLDSVVTPEVRTAALVLLLDHLALSLDPHAGLVQPKLPPVEYPAIPRGCGVWDVEFEPGPIEPKRLAHCLDVRLLERKKDTEAS